MYVVYWKWEVWKWVNNLLKYIWKDCVVVDDLDCEDSMLVECEEIVASPWIPPNHIIHKKFQKKIIWELDVVYDVCKDYLNDKNISFFGVTWTDWKSTVSHLLYESFCKLLPNENNYIWWNFWTSLSEIILEILKDNPQWDINIVVEISSFMLYSLNKFDFKYSIWTNFHADHLNWHGNIDNYFEAKKKILDYTSEKTFVADNLTLDSNKIKKISKDIEFDSKMIWDYNQMNLNLAYNLLMEYFNYRWLCINNNDIIKVLNQVEPLPHRRELIKIHSWVEIYDDWKSTTSNSLNAAIESFDEDIVLICGWSDKWDDFAWVWKAMKKNVKKCFLIWECSSKISKVCAKNAIEYEILDSLEKCVNSSFDCCLYGWINVILFSPWCASFDMFDNRLDRSKKFRQCVDDLWKC